MKNISIYIHIPFCRNRCGYCDFNTYSGKDELIPEYVDNLCRELNFSQLTCSEEFSIHSIYFGGGTPSLLSIEQLAVIVNSLMTNYQVQSDCEITLEANPGTLSVDFLTKLYRLGINRLSIGAQSFNVEELILLDRHHSISDIESAIVYARSAGFENINLDLIYGIPGQTISTWEKSLESALNLFPEHLSLYPLSIERETPIYQMIENSLIHPMDEDTVADMYETATQVLERNDYIQYEISNWYSGRDSSADFRCRHNLQYWRNLEYLGFGAGAHGYANHYRTKNEPNPVKYIFNMKHEKGKGFNLTPATVEFSFVDRQTEMGDTMMLGLRLVQEGISSINFKERFQVSLEDKYTKQIHLFTKLGLLEWTSPTCRCLRLTQRGRLLGNRVFMEFI